MSKPDWEAIETAYLAIFVLGRKSTYFQEKGLTQVLR